ncbi:MAG TPA: aromatic ring-hydroxylating dioxygenase subunit alpha [Steroidobacteraceae bacterium]|jgi:phenylpropionate dioxygenase-like ring-hydroxylating dioxygenase large terminal subunit|nr:aromatic ring-hydroxylating dioxygenase subunit alpha [Steroidobacteraceae bacterium]
MNSTAARPAESLSGRTPRSLPAWVYSHPEMTRLEFERILKPSWQIACHVSQIPSAGDYVTFELGRDSVIVLREPGGTIRALRNVCRHRGTRLLEGAGRCHGRITCPYHGWTYRYDGSLLATPARDSFPGLNLREHSLDAVHAELTMGFVWVCLAADPPPPPSQVWAPFLEELAPYRLEELIPTQPMYFEEWQVDWKIAMDNYLESYHVPIGHPGLNRMMTPDYEDQRAVPGIARGISWMREAPSARWSERIYQKHIAEVSATYLPEPNQRSWRFYSCLPNLGIDIMPEQMDFFQVLPRGPGKALIRGAAFGRPDERREMRLIRWLGNRINMQVNREDRMLCERLQRGIADSAYRPGPLSQIETWMLEFHDLLRARIPEVNLPEPPARFN